MSAGPRPTLVLPADEVPVDRFYRLSIDQYHQMVEAGILTNDDRFELLEGVIGKKHPESSEPRDRFYRLSVSQYHEMARLSILADGEPVELLEGWLVVKMTKTPPHSVATGLVRDALSRAIPAGWFVVTQDPLPTLDSEPEPDAMVVRGHHREYRRWLVRRIGLNPRPPKAANGDLPTIVSVLNSTLCPILRNDHWPDR